MPVSCNAVSHHEHKGWGVVRDIGHPGYECMHLTRTTGVLEEKPESCRPSLSHAQLICTTEPLAEENESWDSMHTYVHVDIHTNTYIHAYTRTHTYTAVVLGQAATPSCFSHSIIFIALDLVLAKFEA